MTDSIQTKLQKEENERLARRRSIEEAERTDSISMDKVLKDALKIANQKIGKDKFLEKYYVVMTDSIPVSVEIDLNFHFTKTTPHLIIRRIDPGTFYFDIYSKNNNEFIKVVSHEEQVNTYVSDTIRDINGDGTSDFVVNWYGNSGCCLKAFSDVYLLRPDYKSFSNNFVFINPTFAPKEKVIRGVCYGHVGTTDMYKYKWNGEKVDTLEYISYEINNKGEKTGKVIVATDRRLADKFKILKVLNSVPAEYRKIYGYDWFTGKGYE